MNIRFLVPELIKASLCIGLTVFVTSTQARGVTAWANIVTCDSKVDLISVKPQPSEAMSRFGVR